MTPRSRFSTQPNGTQGLRKSAQAAQERRLRGFSYLLPGPTLDFHLAEQNWPLRGHCSKLFRQDFFVRQRITFHQDFYVTQQG